MNRRDLLRFSPLALAAGAAFPLQAAGPFERKGARLRVSLAAYSFRNFFKDQRNGKPTGVPPEKQIGMEQFIDFCADHGCDGAELTSYFFPQDIGNEALIAVRRHAFLRNVVVSGTAVGNNFTHPAGEKQVEQMDYVKGWIDRSVAMGAPHIRVFAGVKAKDMSEDDAWKNVIANLRQAGDYAGTKGVFLGIENHDSVKTHETLLHLVKEVNHPWVGVNLDTGNFYSADPYLDMAKSAPYAVNVQVKVELKDGAGKTVQADLPRIVKILRDANYQGWVVLEYEAEPDPYTAVPPLLKQLRELCV